MSVTKHKLFKIPIIDELEFNINEMEELNEFLLMNNFVYVGHSVTVLTQSVKHASTFRQLNKYLVISLVYKDLTESSLDIKKVSKKAAIVVKKSVEENEKIPKPDYKTHFEKNI